MALQNFQYRKNTIGKRTANKRLFGASCRFFPQKSGFYTIKGIILPAYQHAFVPQKHTH